MFVGNFNTFTAKGVVVFDEGAFYVELFENEKTTKDEAYLLYEINIDTIEVIRKHIRKSRVAGGERIMDWEAIVIIVISLCVTFVSVAPLIFG